jgi:hypothetical protein
LPRHFSARWALAVLTAVALFPALAFAGPPYATDDPEPVPYHHWEIYFSTQHELTRAGVSGAAPFVDANFGAAPNLQLHAFAPLAYARPTGGALAVGPGDVEFGTKVRLVQEGEARPMVGIYPAIDLPTGSATKGLGVGHWRLFLPVWLQKSFGAWTAYGGPGYWVNRGSGSRSYWFFGGTLVRRVSDSLSVGGELFHATAAEVAGRGNFRFNLGLTIDVDEHHHLLLSAGRSLVGDTLLQAYVGYVLTI